MMTLHNCLYCGKALNGVLACKCDKSKLKWMTPKEFNDKLIGVLPRHQKCKLEYIQIPQKTMLHNEIKPIYKSDLLSVARELPKIPNIDHEKLILDSYCEGGWVACDRYIDFVHGLAKELGITKQNKSRKQIITEKISNYTKEIVKYANMAYYWLMRNYWISIRKAKNCYFSRRNGYRGKIIFGYSILITFNGQQYPKKQ